MGENNRKRTAISQTGRFSRKYGFGAQDSAQYLFGQ